MIPLAAEIMGAVPGGWEYVIAAYSMTWTLLIGYALSLWLRRPRGGREE